MIKQLIHDCEKKKTAMSGRCRVFVRYFVDLATMNDGRRVFFCCSKANKTRICCINNFSIIQKAICATSKPVLNAF